MVNANSLVRIELSSVDVQDRGICLNEKEYNFKHQTQPNKIVLQKLLL